MRRALILGATGLVGHAVWRQWSRREGWTLLGTTVDRAVPPFRRLDLLDREAVARCVREFGPTVTIIAASNPNVDGCERDPAGSRALNVTATVDAAKAAREAGSSVVWFSSDYVFDGKSAEPYGEDDPVSPINEYGRQKAETEKLVLALGDSIVLRLSAVFGWEVLRKNFVLQVVDRLAAGQPVQASPDLRYNPTYAENLPSVIADLIERGHRGLFHSAGAEEVSRWDLASEAARTFGFKDAVIEKVSVDMRAATRPLHTSLRTDKIRRAVASPLWGPRKALSHMREFEPQWKEESKSLL